MNSGWPAFGMTFSTCGSWVCVFEVVCDVMNVNGCRCVVWHRTNDRGGVDVAGGGCVLPLEQHNSSTATTSPSCIQQQQHPLQPARHCWLTTNTHTHLANEAPDRQVIIVHLEVPVLTHCLLWLFVLLLRCLCKYVCVSGHLTSSNQVTAGALVPP